MSELTRKNVLGWSLCPLLILATVTACQKSGNKMNFEDFQKKAAKYNSVLTLPQFETSAEAVRKTTEEALKAANQRLDEIAKIAPKDANFQNVARAIEWTMYDVDRDISRIYLLSETSLDPKLRETAKEMATKVSQWQVDVTYREDLYKVVKAVEAKKPDLKGEDKKHFKELLRSYRRAGFHLSKKVRDQVKALQKEIAELSTQFQKNITDSKADVVFKKAELEGVPEDVLEKFKQPDGTYLVKAHVTWQYFAVVRNAVQESARKKVFVAANRRALQNIPVLQKVLLKKRQVANLLGYDTWADYKLEIKLAKKSETVRKFLTDIRKGLKPLFKDEIARYQKMKAKDTGNPNAKLYDWDARYYYNQVQKEEYSVDHQKLKVYFPLDQTLRGMFEIYEKIFRLKFHEVDPGYRWEDSVRLFVAEDSKTGEPLGAFYLDLFPREGKYSHFAQFGIIGGAELPDGKYQRPVVALVCNFPSPEKDKPSLLLHDHVETLFHEFGHAMHSVLTRARFPSFSGTSVPRDFVEAPSQMLENWVWDKNVLDRFAADYRDSGKKFPSDVLKKMEKAKKAGNGRAYMFQIMLGSIDMGLHSLGASEKTIDPQKMGNDIYRDVYLPVPSDTSRVASFGHLMGYDAGYYGYLWSLAISEDLASVFRKSSGGFLDEEVGYRLRTEIYEPGDSRDVEVSIREFLGRERSLDPFLEELGIKN